MSSDSQTPDYVRDNTCKIVNEEGKFLGSCFFIEVNGVDYCITCHHCIWKLDAIFVQIGSNENYALKWLNKYSDPTKDIAVMSVDATSQIKPLRYEPKALPELPIYVMGWPEDRVNDLVTASKEDDSFLSSVSIGIKIREETISELNNPWNVKPKGTVYLLGFKGNYNRGLSGSPVCYKATNNVVGIFTAIDDYVHGYALPIQTLLDKFELDKSDSKQSINIAVPKPASDTQKVLEEGNQLLHKKIYFDAIKKYDEIIYDTNYVYAIFNKAYTFGEMGRHEDAIEWYNKSLAINPDDAYALGNKGNALNNLGRYEEAIVWLDKSLAIDPNNANNLGNKGNAK